MARARNIKPGLLKNELLGEADPIMTVAFIGLWMLADKEGRLEDRPKRIRAEIFPYRADVDMNSILDWLKVNSFITRYQSNVGPIISIVKWSKHQRPHHKEVDSVLPAETRENKGSEQDQSKDDPSMAQAWPKHGSSKTLVDQPNPPDTGYRIPDSLIPDTGSSDTEATPLLEDAVDFLKRLVSHHGYDERTVRVKIQNITQAKQWLSDGVTIQELDDAVDISRERMDDRDPPVSYLAKVLSSNRQKSAPVKSGKPAINTHGDFTAERYAINDTARKFKIAGGDA